MTKHHIAVVLHRPIYPRNIGMCARAMGNFGLSQLHIIAPRCDWSSPEIQHIVLQGATHAGDIVRAACIHESIDTFLEQHGQGVRIAFSARDGDGKRVAEFSELLQRFHAEPTHSIWHPETALQLHFGTEDDGLSLVELRPMNFIARLPASGPVSSFNLSHAVLLAIHMTLTSLERDSGKTANQSTPLPSGPLEYPQKAIRAWLEALGFDLSQRRVNIETTLNRVLLSHCPSPEDVRLLEKVLFQTVEKLKTAEREKTAMELNSRIERK